MPNANMTKKPICRISSKNTIKIQNMGKIVDHFWSMSSTSLVLSMLSTLSTLLMSRLREITSRLLLLFLGDPKKFSF